MTRCNSYWEGAGIHAYKNKYIHMYTCKAKHLRNDRHISFNCKGLQLKGKNDYMLVTTCADPDSFLGVGGVGLGDNFDCQRGPRAIFNNFAMSI